MANTTDFQAVLKGLRPSTHFIHTSDPMVRCVRCVADGMARLPIADQLRCYTDGWGTLDLNLAMTDLADAIGAGFTPDFLKD